MKFQQSGKFYSLLLGSWCLLTLGCTSEAVNQDHMVNLETVQNRTELKLADLNIAIQRDRDNAALYAKRAFLFLENKNMPKALADINRAIELDNNEEDYYFRRAVILRDAGKIEQALASAEEAEHLGDKITDVYLLQAELLLRLKRYDEALVKTNAALDEAPANEYALLYKGIAQAARADTASAVYNLRKAVTTLPTLIHPYLQLISIYNGRKEYDLAQAYIKRAEKLDSNNAFLWFQKGLRYKGLHLTDSAYASLTKALNFDPSIYLANYHLGVLAYKQQRFTDVVSNLEKVKAKTDTLNQLTIMLAEGYEKTGRYKNAIREYSKILKQKPDDVKAMWGVRRSNYALYKIKRDSLYEARWQTQIYTEDKTNNSIDE